jgi:hypothetical protein
MQKIKPSFFSKPSTVRLGPLIFQLVLAKGHAFHSIAGISHKEGRVELGGSIWSIRQHSFQELIHDVVFNLVPNTTSFRLDATCLIEHNVSRIWKIGRHLIVVSIDLLIGKDFDDHGKFTLVIGKSASDGQ